MSTVDLTWEQRLEAAAVIIRDAIEEIDTAAAEQTAPHPERAA